MEHLLRKPLENNQVEHRAQWLEAMALAFDEHRLFLDGTITDLESAYVDCNSLSTRSLEEVKQTAIHEIRSLKEGVKRPEGLA